MQDPTESRKDLDSANYKSKHIPSLLHLSDGSSTTNKPTQWIQNADQVARRRNMQIFCPTPIAHERYRAVEWNI